MIRARIALVIPNSDTCVHNVEFAQQPFEIVLRSHGEPVALGARGIFGGRAVLV